MGDNTSFALFTGLCEKLGKESRFTQKQQLVGDFVGSYPGDKVLLVLLLLPKEDRARVYGLKEKQMISILAACDEDAFPPDVMADMLGQTGDLGVAVEDRMNTRGMNQDKDGLDVAGAVAFLDRNAEASKMKDRVPVWERVLKRATPCDVKFLVRLVLKDIKTFMGPRYVLNALHPAAYEAYLINHNLKQLATDLVAGTFVPPSSASQEALLAKGNGGGGGGGSGKGRKAKSVNLALGTPIKPMLASPAKDVSEVLRKCSEGFFVEVKYDGERVQIHKNNDDVKFFARSLKEVLEHKVKGLRDHVRKCVKANTAVLDGEIVLVDMETDEILPFGTLGIHKKQAHASAEVCVFVFDVLMVDDEVVLGKTMQERRDVLMERIDHQRSKRVLLSDMKLGQSQEDIAEMMRRVMREGLEGAMLKDVRGIYEPNARRWFKLKKDYLAGMADTADLVILGGYYGTGAHGGMVSVFLCGALNTTTNKYETVCKVGNGLDEEELVQMQSRLKWEKVQQGVQGLPAWMRVNAQHAPDFVVAGDDPSQSLVLEVEGAEFTTTQYHTAGVSIRFPRIVKIREDKGVGEASTVAHLHSLLEAAAGQAKDVTLLEARGKKRAPPSGKGTLVSMFKKKQAAEGGAEASNNEDDDGGGGSEPKAKRHKASEFPSHLLHPSHGAGKGKRGRSPSPARSRSPSPSPSSGYRSASPSPSSGYRSASPSPGRSASASPPPAQSPSRVQPTPQQQQQQQQQQQHQSGAAAPVPAPGQYMRGCNLVLAFSGAAGSPAVASAVAAGATTAVQWDVLASGGNRPTHLVCDSPDTPLYAHVAALARAHIVLPSWLEECARVRCRVDDAPYHVAEDRKQPGPPRSSLVLPLPDLFGGLVFCVDKGVDEREQVKRTLVAYGGALGKGPSVTHHVVQRREQGGSGGAQSAGCHVVSRGWVGSCIQDGRVLRAF